MLKALLIAIGAIIVLVLGWHLIFFLLGGAIAITASVWSLIIITIIAFCFAILLAFILTGVGIFILSIIAFIGTVFAIAAFPILFPILIPLLIILLFISYLRRREQRQQANKIDK